MAQMPPQMAMVPVPRAKIAPVPTDALSVPAPPDPLARSRDAYEKALDAFQATPEPTLEQPEYQAPNKTGQIVGAALNLLFPGSKIATMASGYLGGAADHSAEEYDRAQKADQQKYAAAEQARSDAAQSVQMAGTQFDRETAEAERAANDRARLEEQADAAKTNAALRQQIIDETKQRDQNAAAAKAAAQAEQHAWHVGQLQHMAGELQLGYGKLGLDSSKLQEAIRRDNMQTAVALTNGTMRADTAAQRMGLTANLAVFREAGQDRRFASTMEYRAATQQVNQLKSATDHAVAVELKSTDDNTDTKAQKIAAIIDDSKKKFDAIMTPVIAANPKLGQAFNVTDNNVAQMIAQGKQQDAVIERNSALEAMGVTPPTDASADTGSASDGLVPPSSSSSYSDEYERNLGLVSQQNGGQQPSHSIMPPAPLVNNISNLLMKVGATPAEARTLAIVAANESGGDPNIVSPPNKNGTYDVGLFQINSSHNFPDAKDPVKAAQWALAEYRRSGLTAWNSSKDQGQYGGWGGAIAAAPGSSGPTWMSNGYDYTTGGRAAVVPPQERTPQQVQQAIPVAVGELKKPTSSDATVGALLREAGFNDAQIQHIINSARQQFNVIEEIQSDKPKAKTAQAPPAAPSRAQPAPPPRLQAVAQNDPAFAAGLPSFDTTQPLGVRPVTPSEKPVSRETIQQRLTPPGLAPANEGVNVPAAIGQAAGAVIGLGQKVGQALNADSRRQADASSLDSAYAQRLLTHVRALSPQQRMAFIAKQPPRMQAYLIRTLRGQ